MKVGDRVGNIYKSNDGKSYYQTSINYKKYFLHRLIWLYMTGKLPSGQIDHEDGDGLNNKWLNLRDVSHSENAKNQKLRSTNKSGVCGVHWDKSRGKWSASLTYNRKDVRLGRYDDWFDAVCARKSAENKFNFHENHGQVRPL